MATESIAHAKTAEHTAGPWRCEVGTMGSFVGDPADKRIAPHYVLNRSGNGAQIVTQDEAHANAALIAAAPDLVGALTPDDIDQIVEAIENFVMGPTEDPELDAIWQPYIDKLNALRDAIVKAGGRP